MFLAFWGENLPQLGFLLNLTRWLQHFSQTCWKKEAKKKNKVCFGAPAGEISAAVSDSRWSTYTAAHNGSSTAPFQTAMLLRRGHNIVLAAIGAEGCLLDYSGVRRDAVTVYTLSGWICHGWFCLRDFRRPRRRANQRDVTSIPQL